MQQNSKAGGKNKKGAWLGRLFRKKDDDRSQGNRNKLGVKKARSSQGNADGGKSGNSKGRDFGNRPQSASADPQRVGGAHSQVEEAKGMNEDQDAGNCNQIISTSGGDLPQVNFDTEEQILRARSFISPKQLREATKVAAGQLGRGRSAAELSEMDA